MLVQSYRKLDELKADKKDIANEEYSNLDAGHPAMTSFLNKIYRQDVLSIGEWLYREQQAYRFLSLENHKTNNIIGRALEGVPSSRYNYQLLNGIQEKLEDKHGEYLHSQGQPPQTFKAARYYIDQGTVEMIRDFNSNSLSRDVTVPHTASDFEGKYDVRLNAVRFFAEGAKVKIKEGHTPTINDDRLEVSLTHLGSEKFVNRQGELVRFTHHPVKVIFKYELSTNKYDGPETTDGTVTSGINDQYAKIGPFTTWHVEVKAHQNPHLDLSGLREAYLEFDFDFRAL